MSSGVTKYVRYAAPYRSKTFNDKDALIFGKNGVVTGGEVSQSGNTATIQPVTIVQNGQIVDISVALSQAVPATLIAPFFIALSISSPIQNVSEVITPIFVKRPQDINSMVVLVAEWDGNEWRSLPKLQISEQIAASAKLNVTNELTGVSHGLNVAVSAGNYVIDAGTLVGADGISVSKTSQTTIPVIGDPANVSQAFDRIDAVVFRKASDSPYRIGTFKNITGPSFVDVTGTAVDPTAALTATSASKIRTKEVYGSESTMVCYIDSSNSLKFTLFNSSLTAGSEQTVATFVDDYQYTSNFDGSIDFVYVRGNTIYFKRVTITNTVVYSETQIYTSAATLTHPNIAVVGKPNDYQIHIVVCKALSGTNREIGYIRIGSDGTVITPYTSFINLTADLRRPSLAKDDDDNLLYIGFDNNDTQRAYLRTYDVSSVTPSLPPTQVGAAIELQTEVYNTTTATTMPTTGALDVRVIRTDNKKTYAMWFHFKSAGQYGVAIYCSDYKEKFGYKALMLDNEDVTAFSVKMDSMNRLYQMGVVSGNIKKNVFNLETAERIGTSDTLYTGTATSVSTQFCPRGDLLTSFNDTTGQVIRSTAAVKTTLSSQVLCDTDTYLAYRRVSDAQLSVSDTLIGEEQVIKRLYEYGTLFGAAGSVSWNTAGANKLVLSQVTLRFLSRQSTYTIPATAVGGISVPSGYVIYTNIPDEDVDTTLSLTVAKFGTGLLDRAGKTAVPLFWNIGGRLFSNFSPYSFDAGGETVTIGGTISDELIAWLGCGDTAPDPSNHGYSSTTYILQSDSLLTAIGKLDAAVAGVVAGGTAAIIPLFQGDTSVSIIFGAPRSSGVYRIVPTFENTIDDAPMMQTCMITTKVAAGFTISWPCPLDSGNYVLDYLLRDTV